MRDTDGPQPPHPEPAALAPRVSLPAADATAVHATRVPASRPLVRRQQLQHPESTGYMRRHLSLRRLRNRRLHYIRVSVRLG